MLARSARNLIAKIAGAVPERLLPFAPEPTAGTPPGGNFAPDGLDLSKVRTSIRAGRKIRLNYRDENGIESRRLIWPITKDIWTRCGC